MINNQRFCTECGTQIESTARFCLNCGHEQMPDASIFSANPPLKSTSGIFEIIGETFGIYRRNFTNLITIAAVVNIPIAVFTWLLFISLDVPAEDDFDFGFFMDIGTRALIAGIIGAFGWLLMQGALIHAISEQFHGRPIQVKQSYSVASSRFLSMLGSIIVFAVALILMAITIIGIPFAIAFAVFWFFVLQFTLLEGLGPKESLTQSYKLVRGHWLWTLGFLLVSGILFGIISGIATSIFGFLIPEIGTAIGEALTVPLLVTAETLFYFELKQRQVTAA